MEDNTFSTLANLKDIIEDRCNTNFNDKLKKKCIKYSSLLICIKYFKYSNFVLLIFKNCFKILINLNSYLGFFVVLEIQLNEGLLYLNLFKINS